MSWEQRLRDLALAGGAAGALAAVGCVGGSVAGGDSGSDGNVGPDVGFNFCCNANADPCCTSLYCGAPVTAQCTEKMACESDGGTWDDFTQACSPLEDSAAADAPSDAPTYPDVTFCCNANADPCCPSLYCGAPVTVECVEKMDCESDGGVWGYGGRQQCVLYVEAGDVSSDPPETGRADAGVDGHGQPD